MLFDLIKRLTNLVNRPKTLCYFVVVRAFYGDNFRRELGIDHVVSFGASSITYTHTWKDLSADQAYAIVKACYDSTNMETVRGNMCELAMFTIRPKDKMTKEVKNLLQPYLSHFDQYLA